MVGIEVELLMVGVSVLSSIMMLLVTSFTVEVVDNNGVVEVVDSDEENVSNSFIDEVGTNEVGTDEVVILIGKDVIDEVRGVDDAV